MLLAQVIFVFFALVALLFTATRFRKKEISRGWFLFWMFFWLAVAVAVIIPQTTTFLAEKVGIGRGVDLVIYLSIIALFYLLFRLFVRIERMEKNITKLVEKDALDKFKNNDGK